MKVILKQDVKKVGKRGDIVDVSDGYGRNFLIARGDVYKRQGAQCMISGTGFVVSAKVMKDNEGWPYYLLTEDIQFSVVSTINQLKIGYCDTAILYLSLIHILSACTFHYA